MAATYTFEVVSSLDGYGAHSGNWGGLWGRQGPELLDHRLDLYDQEARTRQPDPAPPAPSRLSAWVD